MPMDVATTGFWSFYAADPLAIFFKRFALVTTILVLVMMIDYAPVVRESIHGATQQSGLGEFFALPIFTCVGSDVDGVRDRLRHDLRLARTGHDLLLRPGQLHPTQSGHAGSGREILDPERALDRLSGLRHYLDFRCDRRDESRRVSTALLANPAIETGPALFGMVLVLVALGFKIAAVPFQMWVPDVYQGAPTPVTAFLSVGSKAAGFVVLLRVLQPFFMLPQMERLLTVIALLTLIYGNLAALPQSNLKRLLAYSSIAHAGYLLIGVVSFAGEAVAFYLVGYLLMTLLSFAVLIVVAQQTGENIEDFNGLAKRSPFLAFAMLIAMASLAGVPFTAGFLGKFFIFDAAIRHHQTALVVVGCDHGCVRILLLSESRARDVLGGTRRTTARFQLSGLSRLAMAAMIAGIIFLGVYPQPILNALKRITANTRQAIAR